MKRSWKKKDSGTSKKRENAMESKRMTYCCEDCGFLFRRIDEVQDCPFCESYHFRSATAQEKTGYMNYSIK